MLTPDERKKIIPPMLKYEIGFFYVGARGLDPVNRIAHCRNCVSALTIAVGITKEAEILPQLEEARANCTRALKFYEDGNWTKAVYYIDLTLDSTIGPLVHGGFASIKESDFSYTPEVKNGD